LSISYPGPTVASTLHNYHDWGNFYLLLVVSIRSTYMVEEQQQRWSCTMRIFPSLLVLPTEEWQQVNMHCQLSVVTGDEGRLGGSDMCLCVQGKQTP